MSIFAHLFIILILPIFLIGTINRTKALWAGRKGLPLNQFFFDLLRLLRKNSVYSEVSTWVFQLAPWVILASTLLASLITPLFPGFTPFSFSYDFVVAAYLLALGRVFLILGAMDTGSSFEGMGASREASFAALIEPALFLTLGTLSLTSGKSSFQDLFGGMSFEMGLGLVLRVGLFISLFILLQTESARVPVDDPNTHLELTMIHEVMILDHSGPELAALQYGSAIKMTLLAGILSCLLNPFNFHSAPRASIAFAVASLVGIAILIGLIESLIARFKLRVLPRYFLVGVLAGSVSLMTVWMLHWRGLA